MAKSKRHQKAHRRWFTKSPAERRRLLAARRKKKGRGFFRWGS